MVVTRDGKNYFLKADYTGWITLNSINLSFTGLSGGTAFKPGGGPWAATSDVRLKKNVKPLKNALTRMLELRGVSFEWKEPEKQGNLTGQQIGFIGQEVKKVFPEWITRDQEGYLGISIRGFEVLTVEAVRELKMENEQLQRRIENLEKKLAQR